MAYSCGIFVVMNKNIDIAGYKLNVELVYVPQNHVNSTSMLHLHFHI